MDCIEKEEDMKNMKIREAKKEDLYSIAKVQVESNRSSYKGIMPEEYLKNLSADSIAKS